MSLKEQECKGVGAQRSGSAKEWERKRAGAQMKPFPVFKLTKSYIIRNVFGLIQSGTEVAPDARC